ncbi:MAG: universal stress protein [Bacteroidota bacterium]
MIKILCPTDMSEHSVTALHYAVNLANDLDAELHVITAYQVSKKASSFINIEDQVKGNTTEDLEKVMEEITPMIKNDRAPHVRVYRGNPVNVILKYSEANAIDLIVMGTQGDNSLRTLLFGSVTAKVGAKADIPMLAIPEAVKERLQSNKILMALDNKVLEHEATFRVPKSLAERLGLKIDILHIADKDEDFPFDPYISTYLGDTIGEVHIKNGKDPVNEIKVYAENNNVGILIMIRRERSFFSKLFQVGNTAQEIAKTDIPLMILPE